MRMILICMLISAALGTLLYQMKTGINDRERELAKLENEIKASEREIALLETELAHLSRPERINALSTRLLALGPITRDRILSVDDIPMRALPDFDDSIEDISIIVIAPGTSALDDEVGQIQPRRPTQPAPPAQPARRGTGAKKISLLVPVAPPSRKPVRKPVQESARKPVRGTGQAPARAARPAKPSVLPVRKGAGVATSLLPVSPPPRKSVLQVRHDAGGGDGGSGIGVGGGDTLRLPVTPPRNEPVRKVRLDAASYGVRNHGVDDLRVDDLNIDIQSAGNQDTGHQDADPKDAGDQIAVPRDAGGPAITFALPIPPPSTSSSNYSYLDSSPLGGDLGGGTFSQGAGQ